MKVRTEDQRNYYKALFVLVKFLPVLSAFILCSHVALRWAGINIPFLGNLFTSSLPRMALMYIASHAFGFCWLHRAFILYNLYITMCFIYSNEIGFHNHLLLHQVMTIVFGFLLFHKLYKEWDVFNRRCRRNGRETYKQILKEDSGRY